MLCFAKLQNDSPDFTRRGNRIRIFCSSGTPRYFEAFPFFKIAKLKRRLCELSWFAECPDDVSPFSPSTEVLSRKTWQVINRSLFFWNLFSDIFPLSRINIPKALYRYIIATLTRLTEGNGGSICLTIMYISAR